MRSWQKKTTGSVCYHTQSPSERPGSIWSCTNYILGEANLSTLHCLQKKNSKNTFWGKILRIDLISKFVVDFDLLILIRVKWSKVCRWSAVIKHYFSLTCQYIHRLSSRTDQDIYDEKTVVTLPDGIKHTLRCMGYDTTNIHWCWSSRRNGKKIRDIMPDMIEKSEKESCFGKLFAKKPLISLVKNFS